MTADIEERFNRHNNGREKTTRPYTPFILVYTEECKDRTEARKLEKYWKSGIGKEKLKMLKNKII